MTVFDTMSKDEALDYCYKHRKEYEYETDKRTFDCLIAIIESGSVQPNQLPEYGMNYES